MQTPKNPLVYVIEDDEAISKLICLYLSKSDIDTKPFTTAEDAIEGMKEKLPDLIILDLNLPCMSGFDFLDHFRKEYSRSIPVVIVSARDDDNDIIQGLGFGADEFVTKPFSPSVLVARIKANLRRQALINTKGEDSISFDDYTLMLNSCVLKKGNHKIPLSTKEYEVLEYLVTHAGEVLLPEKIYNAVWKVQYGDITAVAVYIQRLRKKMEKDPSKNEYIKTEFGKGYIFSKEVIRNKDSS